MALRAVRRFDSDLEHDLPAGSGGALPGKDGAGRGSASGGSASGGAVDIRGRSFTALSIVVPPDDLSAFLNNLSTQVERANRLFADAPVVLDLSGLETSSASEIDTALACTVAQLRALALVPVGVQGGGDVARNVARRHQLANLRGGVTVPTPAPQPARDTGDPAGNDAEEAGDGTELGPEVANAGASGAATAKAAPTTMIVDRPVRSGERVVAEHGDMIVTGAVGSGAEVMAAGSVHLYGSLRGRAVAGMFGDENARLFCQRLEAELVAIAGLYKLADDIPAGLRGAAVQIALAGDTLEITTLGGQRTH